jgi:hypothetical protein
MALREDEIDRCLDETVAGRSIERSLYCAECGYNVRGLPVIGVCPECGHRYNARRHKMTGIFRPHALALPISEVLSALLSLGVAAVFAAWAVQSPEQGWAFLPVLVFGVLGALFVRVSYLKLARYVHLRNLVRRIREEE